MPFANAFPVSPTLHEDDGLYLPTAWYLNDEIHASDPRLRTHQQWAIEGDSDHPTWQVVSAMDPAYVGTSDAFGVDYYPIGYEGQNASCERGSATSAVTATDGARPIWMALQTMDWTVYNRPECKRVNNTCHTPTYREVRSMSWQSIAAGELRVVRTCLFAVRLS